MHIDNLYKDQTILMFKECYALEKIHGTSTYITFNVKEKTIHYSSGCITHSTFVKLFNEQELIERFSEIFPEHMFDSPNPKVSIFGEGYGGSTLKMSATYGNEIKFIAFDVKVGNHWLNVPNAEDVALKLGLEFVAYEKITTDLESIDRERDKDSTQAIRNGIGEGKMREGIVLKPLIEVTLNNGSRIISKHKRDEFKETATRREVLPEMQAVLDDANAIANEWVTEIRLEHVLDKLPQDIDLKSTGMVIQAMVEDVLREADGEIVDSKEARKAISSRAAKLFKNKINNKGVN